METAPPAIRLADWAADEPNICAVRTQVFVIEQGIPEALDFDGSDCECLHALAFAQGAPIATGRMTCDGHIGRLAVVQAWRNQGIGSAVVRFFVVLARERGLERVTLNAQEPAIGFYRRLGFVPQGNPFMEAGIPHIRMDRHTTG